MEKIKGLTTLPAVDERSPPEEETDEMVKPQIMRNTSRGARNILVNLCGWQLVQDQILVPLWEY